LKRQSRKRYGHLTVFPQMHDHIDLHLAPNRLQDGFDRCLLGLE
jgi:hypothetical protein